MNILKKLTFVLLSTVYVHANYTFKPKTSVQYPVHPIAQECNKNAEKIRKHMKRQGFFPIKFSGMVNNNVQTEREEQDQLKIYILPLWLILQNLKKGSLDCIVFAE
jgi:hypothetical protein